MFEITIIEKRYVKRLEGKEWGVIGEKEVEREERFYNHDDLEPKTIIKKAYGYTPEIEKTVEEKREVLKQVVEVLDLATVIKAINKL